MTPFVLKEYSGGGKYNFKNRIKSKGGKMTRDELEYHRQIKREKLEKGRLIRLLEESKRVVMFNENEKELYEEMKRKCSLAGIKKGLSDADLDLLVSGAVISQIKGNTCLVSNDFPLLFTWVNFMRQGRINKRRLGFYLRNNFNEFKRVHL